MELYITGDTHGDFSRFRPESFYEQERLTKEDVILVAGDFGGVWYGDSRDDAGLNFLDSRPFTTAFVSGNHENYDALAAYPQAEWHGGRVRTIRPSVLMLERGQVF
ncbi:metallophosphoesterase, partial [Flavonifractor plautii]